MEKAIQLTFVISGHHNLMHPQWNLMAPSGGRELIKNRLSKIHLRFSHNNLMWRWWVWPVPVITEVSAVLSLLKVSSTDACNGDLLNSYGLQSLWWVKYLTYVQAPYMCTHQLQCYHIAPNPLCSDPSLDREAGRRFWADDNWLHSNWMISLFLGLLWTSGRHREIASFVTHQGWLMEPSADET